MQDANGYNYEKLVIASSTLITMTKPSEDALLIGHIPSRPDLFGKRIIKIKKGEKIIPLESLSSRTPLSGDYTVTHTDPATQSRWVYKLKTTGFETDTVEPVYAPA